MSVTSSGGISLQNNLRYSESVRFSEAEGAGAGGSSFASLTDGDLRESLDLSFDALMYARESEVRI